MVPEKKFFPYDLVEKKLITTVSEIDSVSYNKCYIISTKRGKSDA